MRTAGLALAGMLLAAGIAAAPGWSPPAPQAAAPQGAEQQGAASEEQAGAFSDPEFSTGAAGDRSARIILPEERAARLFQRTYPHVQEALEIGEKLVFSVRYGVVRAGTATIELAGVEDVAGDSCYHFVTTAESNDFFSTFFYVRDRVESFIAMKDLRPRRFEKYLLEGNYQAEQIVQFDHATNMATYQDGRIFEMMPGSHDVLSAFVDVRCRDLRVGDEIQLECHADRKNYPLKTTVLRRERIEVPAGEFDCLVVEPMLRTPGLFKHEGSLTIWLTDDTYKIPVKMMSSLPIGSISVVLTELTRRNGGTS